MAGTLTHGLYQIMNPGEIALRLTAVRKQFPGVVALDGVDLQLRRGEIHALVGENGAGKSTLIKILSGVERPDAGHVEIAGVEATIHHPSDARRYGISTVPQDILIVPELSIGRNILLGFEGPAAARNKFSSEERRIVDQALAKVGASFDATTKARLLSVPHLRLAQIARALIHVGEIMVLDEPTAVLSEPDAEHLLNRLLAFRAEGKAILHVTHRLSEVMRLADRITILRDGRRVGHFLRGEIDRPEIVRLMTKVGNAERIHVGHVPSGEPNGNPKLALQVSHLTAEPWFADVSFSASPGEVIGIAGVQGSGHGHLLRAIAGVDEIDEGTVRIGRRSLRRGSIRQSFECGMLLVPADRRRAGIVPSMSVRDNIIFSGRVRKLCRRFGLRWPVHESAVAQYYARELNVRPLGIHVKTGNLSGGNQQKVVIARALEASASVLLVEEPTQGIDVGTKADIHMLLTNVARQKGCAVVVASSEFEELIGLADTIHIMRLGRLVQTLPGSTATYREILEHALP
jgi:ABC-type sugar transport system ATPase subunit